ncbi:DUF1659 domain-containing protein [Tumebacillus permanentifrigoris]|uniref:Uncharacterized protein DUF1659 n=2 Tax=Tumebacillus permanentifrigoris TaxID=378543 RepID=A0A316DRV2_9BACL|nr:DUF1659 domain-containing protein [Tumebacillus permanentifrigoris]PWK07878.1 uncharacterized protein DUF1659 [Tumebacillus permanentifrigoris]PWK07885.1 uncharacterized protein DUF1659 [Tumebacillus permanentifrigoris]
MINSNQGWTSMVLRLQTGFDEKGSPQYKDKAYSRVLPSATQVDVYTVGEALASLTSYRLHHIQLLNRQDLTRI